MTDPNLSRRLGAAIGAGGPDTPMSATEVFEREDQIRDWVAENSPDTFSDLPRRDREYVEAVERRLSA